MLTSLDTDFREEVLTKRPSDAAPSLSFLPRPPLLDSSLFSPADLADDCLPDDLLDDPEALDEPPEPCLPDNYLFDEYGDLLDLDLLDEFLGDLPDLDLLGEHLDDLLDLELLGEPSDDLLALDLLNKLLLPDLLASAPDADLLEDLAAADPLEDEPLDPLLDIPSTNLGKAAAPDMML